MTDDCSCNVLIVDDLPANLAAMDSVLDDLENINLVHAKNGVEALECVLKQRFAVMLLDVNMPDMDGYEVARFVSNNPLTKYLPIVMVTALGHSEEEVLKAYQAGAVDYLEKPIVNEVLLSKVKQFVALYQAHEKAAQSLLDIAELRKEEEIILNAVGEGIVKLNLQGGLEYANVKALTILELDSSNIADSHFNQWFVNDGDRDIFSDLYGQLKTKRQLLRCRLDVLLSDKNILPIEAVCTFAESSQIAEASVIVIFQDISERLEMENKLIELAKYDSLTQLSNRGYFQESLHRAIGRAKRNGSIVGLYSIDLDRFKVINDTLGHDVGDALLKEVSNRLRLTLRDIDIISRLGGDEFAVIVEDLDAGVSSGSKIAEKLVKQLAKPYKLTTDGGETNELIVECSIGVAYSVAGNMDSAAFVKAADLALYEAKHAGRNTYRVYIEQMSVYSKQHATIEQQLRATIAGKGLSLYYQPQVSLSERRVTGFEALVRWFPEDSNITPISPAVFIPIAEQSRLIHTIGEMVLFQACQQLESWAPFFYQHQLTLSVNLSAKQLMVPNFIEVIDRITAGFSFERNLMVFEITETAVLDQSNSSIATLRLIKDRGFGLSLDDFGTGYSSLSYLQNIPVDYIKIDRCFTQEMHKNKKNFALVKAIMAIAKTFSLDVVAEGVENREELQCLASLNCDKIQGYYFSKPVPASKMEEVVNSIKNQLAAFVLNNASTVTSNAG